MKTVKPGEYDLTLFYVSRLTHKKTALLKEDDEDRRSMTKVAKLVVIMLTRTLLIVPTAIKCESLQLVMRLPSYITGT